MSNRFAHKEIVAKLERADKHICDFNACWIAAREASPPEVISKRDPQSGEVSYYIAELTPISTDLRLIAGDALQNLRSALDHLVCAMVTANAAAISRRTGFPIFESSAKYAHPDSGASGKVKGLPQPAIDAIDRIKPYEGGNDILWILHSLNNTDKHRLLLMAGIALTGQSLLPSAQRALLEMFRYSHPGAPDPECISGVFALGPGPVRILQNGDHLETVPASEANQHIQFTVEVAFAETGIARGRSVAPVLRLIESEVRRIVDDFASFL